MSQHYVLFFDALGTATGMGNSFEYNTLCIDIYMLNDNKTAYVMISQCVHDFFISTGTEKYSVNEVKGVLYFVRDNGEFFTAIYDENGTDLWINYHDTQMRMRPVSSLSYFEDIQ